MSLYLQVATTVSKVFQHYVPVYKILIIVIFLQTIIYPLLSFKLDIILPHEHVSMNIEICQHPLGFSLLYQVSRLVVVQNFLCGHLARVVYIVDSFAYVFSCHLSLRLANAIL